MKVSQAIEQLYRKLPFLTDKFSDAIDITEIVFSGLTATITTGSAHGLEEGDTCTVLGIYAPLDILSIERTADKLLVTTVSNHDLTKGYQLSVAIAGSTESEFNGTFSILDVVDGTSFLLQTTDAGATVATGSPFLQQETGANYNQITGYKTVVEAPNANSLTFALTNALNATIQGLGRLAVGYRITGATTFESALAMYTNQNDGEYWAFVVSGPSVASKDRQNNSDAVYTFNQNTAFRQEINQNFSVYVFANSSDYTDAYPIKDDMQDISTFLIGSLVGAKFDNGLRSGSYYANVFDNHLTQFYNGAIYAHNFIFQTTTQMTNDDIFVQESDVALRDIDFDMSSIVKSFEIKPNTQILDGQINL